MGRYNYNLKLNEFEENGPINTFIVTAVHEKYIKRCLKTLNDTVDRKKHRIIFVEAPSLEDRDIIYWIVDPYVDVYLRTDKNYGYLKAVNMGVRLCTTPYFTVVHDDVWFLHEGWWDEMKEVLDKDEKLLMVQPSQRWRREKGKKLPEFPTEEEYQKLRAECASGSLSEIYCMIFKSEWIEKIGYFDERIYPIGPEDLEIYRQAAAHGYRIATSNAAMVYHKGAGRMDASGGSRIDFEQSHHFNNKWGGDDKLAVGGLSSGNVIQPKFKSLIRHL